LGWKKLAALLFGLYTTLNTLAYGFARWRAYSTQRPPVPPKTATIAVTIWNEPKSLVIQCLNSIKSQTALIYYPQMFEIIAVNGLGIEHAYPYVDKVLYAEWGKLNAKHLAFLEARGEVVVFVDADVLLPPASLSLILEPFRDPTVVAVASSTDMGLLESFVHLPSLFFWWNIKLTGRFCAVRRDAYFMTGGFNLNIPQQNRELLIAEEEFVFRRELEKIGKVVLVDIPVIQLHHPEPRGLQSYAVR
jgi:glycosyltransferase involved in cell wall biosynthesis